MLVAIFIAANIWILQKPTVNLQLANSIMVANVAAIINHLLRINDGLMAAVAVGAVVNEGGATRS